MKSFFRGGRTCSIWRWQPAARPGQRGSRERAEGFARSALRQKGPAGPDWERIFRACLEQRCSPQRNPHWCSCRRPTRFVHFLRRRTGHRGRSTQKIFPPCSGRQHFAPPRGLAQALCAVCSLHGRPRRRRHKGSLGGPFTQGVLSISP